MVDCAISGLMTLAALLFLVWGFVREYQKVTEEKLRLLKDENERPVAMVDSLTDKLMGADFRGVLERTRRGERQSSTTEVGYITDLMVE